MLQNNNSGQLTAGQWTMARGPARVANDGDAPAWVVITRTTRGGGRTMIPLTDFNQLPADEAAHLLEPCVAIDDWVTALVQARPYPNLRRCTPWRSKSLAWGEPELDLALSAHPRIGEKPAARHGHAALSRQEQAAVNDRDASLIQALTEGNARYEARFGRVFLIRAKGRSGRRYCRR
jgi:2-oxo-4-hydroxy-4-carboxy-5-ureidoimidazoline decarboxylase